MVIPDDMIESESAVAVMSEEVSPVVHRFYYFFELVKMLRFTPLKLIVYYLHEI